MELKEYIKQSLTEHYGRPITMTFNQSGIQHFKDDGKLYGSVVVNGPKNVLNVSELDGTDFTLPYEAAKVTKSVKSVVEKPVEPVAEVAGAKPAPIKTPAKPAEEKAKPKPKSASSKQPYEVRDSVTDEDFKINIIIGKEGGPYKLFPMKSPLKDLNKGIITMRVRTASAHIEPGEKVLNEGL
jgi:hypothetical protein